MTQRYKRHCAGLRHLDNVHNEHHTAVFQAIERVKTAVINILRLTVKCIGHRRPVHEGENCAIYIKGKKLLPEC